MRYLSNYIDPNSGREKLGTGGDAQAFHEYASIENVIRFGLAKDGFPPGQYRIYSWPRGTSVPRFLRVAYKRV